MSARQARIETGRGRCREHGWLVQNGRCARGAAWFMRTTLPCARRRGHLPGARESADGGVSTSKRPTVPTPSWTIESPSTTNATRAAHPLDRWARATQTPRANASREELRPSRTIAQVSPDAHLRTSSSHTSPLICRWSYFSEGLSVERRQQVSMSLMNRCSDVLRAR